MPRKLTSLLLLAPAGLLFFSATDIAFGQGRPVCRDPSVSLEIKECGDGHFQTIVKVTNTCRYCNVHADVRMGSGRQAIFTGVRKNGGTQQETVLPCGDEQDSVSQAHFSWSCPRPAAPPAPKATAAPPPKAIPGLDLSNPIPNADSDLY
jgi:hypothetical protein